MVEISEESSERSGETSNARTGAASAAPIGIIEFLKLRSTDSVLWLLRLTTIFFALYYTLSIGGAQSHATAYTRTLLAAASTNALRLHQRLGGFRFDRQFLAEVFVEDSCHYLIYSVLFLSCSPMTMALMPIFLFGVLHASSFTIQMLTATGHSTSFLHRWLTALTTSYTQTLLQVISCTEIFLMPMLIVMIFMGKASLFLPFVYYRFLSLRYVSRRNPNTRMAFHQMRMALEQAVSHAGCPSVFRTAAHKLISIGERLCPTAI